MTRSIPISTTSLLAVTFLAAASPAQLQWRDVTPAVSPSGPMGFAPAAYDEARDRTVMIYGYLGNNPPDGIATWEWDGSTWQEVPSAQRPAWRSGHSLVYDSSRQRVLLFGGSERIFRGDTWEWDGNNWVLRATTGPSPRHDQAVAYDRGRQRAVLFGGLFSTTVFGDTWEWNGALWLRRFPASSPSPRTNHAMAYDQARGVVILFGGLDAGTGAPLGDTWTWDGTDWTQLSPAVAPPPRGNFALTYDVARQRVVLFGGIDSSQRLSDVWEWDGATWHERTTVTAPSPRNDMALAYETERRQIVGFGGFDDGGKVTDTWLLEPVNPASFTSFGSGCPGSAGTPALTAGTLPWLGETFSLRVNGVPPAAVSGVYLLVGVSDRTFDGFALPLDLSAFGMPGCSLSTGADVIVPLPASNGTATAAIGIPNLAGLVGRSCFFQAAIIDPGANALGLVLTDAGTARVGGS